VLIPIIGQTKIKPLIWNRCLHRAGIILQAQVLDHDHTLTLPDSEDLDMVGNWTLKNKIGRRTSYTNFEFASELELSIFLLRWG